MSSSEIKPEMTAALSGIRVLDLAQNDTGSLCAEMLAWLGADVVKVEPPDGGYGRHADARKPGADSYEFLAYNANKRSVTCDMASDDGRHQLRALIANADVLLDSRAPGALARMGFGYDVAHSINPRIIYAQIHCFASGDPREKYLGSDRIAQALGGIAAGTGYEGGTPLVPGATIADSSSALHCAMGIMAALHQRHTTGCGQKVETVMQGAVITLNRRRR